MFHAPCSMLFNVPQFIDIEDKIVGPLTAKQLGWIAMGGVILLIFWATLDQSAFFVVALIDAAIFGSLAFYRPYNQPLSKFILSSIHFVSRPKIYIWGRSFDNIRKVNKATPKKPEITAVKKVLNSEKIKEISEILDMEKRS